MAEFTRDWTDERVRAFNRWDFNRDGFVVPDEALKNQSKTTQSRLPEEPGGRIDEQTAFEPDYSASPVRLSDVERQQQLRAVAGAVLRRYDSNRSGVLEESEWGALPWRNDPTEADENHDGSLTEAELANVIAGAGR